MAHSRLPASSSEVTLRLPQPYGYDNPGCDDMNLDDPGEFGLERDPTDDAYVDVGERAGQYECCGEVRLNCTQFHDVLSEQAAELKQSAQKIDCKKTIRGCFSRDKLTTLFPIIKWAPKYRVAELQGDLIAGVTVGMTCIPQSIAYAGIAGVPPQYGLYSAFIGCFVYVVFGTSKDIALGPTAIMSLMTASYGGSPIPGDITYAVLLGFFIGIVQMVMWAIGLGFVIDYISYPVMKAFTTACAITILMSQVKKWWGLKGVPRDFIPQLIETVKRIPQTRLWDFLLGLVCIFFIVLLRKLKERPWKRKFRDLPLHMKIFKKTIWLLGTARNIVVLVLASVVAFIFLENGMRPFSLTGYIPPGIPPFRAPNFTVTDPKSNVTYTLADVTGRIGIGFIIVPIIGLIESFSIGRVCARKFNYKMDPNQELLVYGIANFLGAFVMGYPVAGAFSRSAVNAGSGVKTPAGGIVSGVIILLALQFLTPLFYYIPEAALGVVIIMAVIDPITFHKVWIFWRTRKIDLIPWIVTFVLSFVLSIEYGIGIGVIVSLVLLLYPATRPKIKVRTSTEGAKLLIIEVANGLMFPAMEYVKEKIIGHGLQGDAPKGVVMDFAHVAVMDTTAVQGVRELLEDFHKKNISVVFCNLQKPADGIFNRAQPKYFVKTQTVDDACNLILYGKSDKVKMDAYNGHVQQSPEPVFPEKSDYETGDVRRSIDVGISSIVYENTNNTHHISRF